MRCGDVSRFPLAVDEAGREPGARARRPPPVPHAPCRARRRSATKARNGPRSKVRRGRWNGVTRLRLFEPPELPFRAAMRTSAKARGRRNFPKERPCDRLRRRASPIRRRNAVAPHWRTDESRLAADGRARRPRRFRGSAPQVARTRRLCSSPHRRWSGSLRRSGGRSQFLGFPRPETGKAFRDANPARKRTRDYSDTTTGIVRLFHRFARPDAPCGRRFFPMRQNSAIRDCRERPCAGAARPVRALFASGASRGRPPSVSPYRRTIHASGHSAAASDRRAAGPRDRTARVARSIPLAARASRKRFDRIRTRCDGGATARSRGFERPNPPFPLAPPQRIGAPRRRLPASVIDEFA